MGVCLPLDFRISPVSFSFFSFSLVVETKRHTAAERFLGLRESSDYSVIGQWPEICKISILVSNQ
jgi:hypothetical protein